MIHSSTAKLRSPHPGSASRTPPRRLDVDSTADPSGADSSGVAPPAFDPLYSIRLATDPGTPCHLCAAETGSGPVGYRDEEPLCDLCLFEEAPELGMVLALVAVVRAYASIRPASADEHREALNELGFFARMYELFAAKSGPMRWILRRIWVH